MDREVDIAIIGTGTAGMAAYRKARERTDSLALIEGGAFGTTCARVGCMPSKLLIAAAERAEAVRGADMFGIRAEPPRIDGAAVMARLRAERDRFVGFVREAVEGFDPAHRVEGHARFRDPHTLAIEGGDTIRAGRIVIATGSRPARPRALEAAGDRLAVNDDVFDWQDLPGSVAVFGGGVIGLELGQALARLGVRVCLFGKGGDVGPLTDPDVAGAAAAAVRDHLPFNTDADIHEIRRERDGIRLTFLDDRAERHERFDMLLAATGRRPNLDTLDIEKAGLALDDRGVPVFDPLTMRAGESHIFLAGDASARIPLLHEAADDGRIAGENAARFPEVLAHRRRAPLAIVFTDPAIAIAGQSRAALDAERCDYAVGEVDFADQGRARVIGANRGLLRVYGERGTGRLLGAEMAAPGGEHMAHLLAWAVQARLDVPAMLEMPFYHPVLEEGLRTALRDLCARLHLRPEAPARDIDCGPGA